AKATLEDQQQVRWIFGKTRSHESKQQIAHRLWLSVVLYGLGKRGLRFDNEGQIHWDDGITGRIGLSPDGQLDLAWSHSYHEVYVASFRAPDGTVARGKGRQRWYIYRLAIDLAVDPLMQRRQHVVNKKVALIIASETYATRPQLPRDFYGGDHFQQACIDAQDQHFDHMLVLSPEHGVISLDDTVPSDKAWSEVLEHSIWPWQMLAVQQLGMYLSKTQNIATPSGHKLNGWVWFDPASTYTFTVFGGGFAVRVLFDHLLRARNRMPHAWPNIIPAEYRRGYIVEDFEEDFDLDFDDEELPDDLAFELTMQEINQLLAWATDFVGLVAIHIVPTGEIWEIAPDEALIPIRLLSDTGQPVDDLLDLLTDIMLLLEQPIPLSMILNPGLVVSAILQITHNLVHNESESTQDILSIFQNPALQQFIEKVLQEPNKEDRLCACLTLAEQLQLVALAIPSFVAEQLLIWMQTYISARLRQSLLKADEGGEANAPPSGKAK
ncbi:MAG: hypothetical protein K8S97_02725, partial [Anaerolineae bacterium]|nr:hypothetical protein [Anaerolineae bacterium]